MKKKSKHKNYCLIGYTKPPVSKEGNFYIRYGCIYYNIITEFRNIPIKYVRFGMAASDISKSILNKDKVIKDAYEKTISV